MAVLLSELPESFATAEVLPHKTWTRAELEVLESTGLVEGRHFELIEGELIDKMGKKRRHYLATAVAAEALRDMFGRDVVLTESPIDIAVNDNPSNEPEPDVMVLRRPFRELERNATYADLALVVEVADSSLNQDLHTKSRLYARAGIEEYWVLDVANPQLHVLRQPSPSTGLYRVHLKFAVSDTVSPLAAPGRSLAVSSLLP